MSIKKHIFSLELRFCYLCMYIRKYIYIHSLLFIFNETCITEGWWPKCTIISSNLSQVRNLNTDFVDRQAFTTLKNVALLEVLTVFHAEGLFQKKGFHEYDSKLHLMIRFEFWKSCEHGVPFHCHYSQVHSDLEW